MSNFIHRWLNPHCTHCNLERECRNCDTLKFLLEQERKTNKELLNALIGPKETIITEVERNTEPIKRGIPWRVRKEALETEDRAKAKVLREKKLEAVEANKSTEELEKELLEGTND